MKPVPVSVRSKAMVFGRSHDGIAGSNPAGAWLSVLSVVSCHVEVSATGRSLVQRNPTDCVCVCVCVCFIVANHETVTCDTYSA